MVNKDVYITLYHYNTKILFKIFGAMSKEMFREISKCFGINPLEEVISARRDKFLKRYCTSVSISN